MAQSQPNRGAGYGWHGMSLKRPVDLEHLSRQTSGDPHIEREALHLFVVQSRLCLQRLRHALGERERAEAAHTLKGSASAVGAWGIAEYSEQLEQHALGNDRAYRDVLADLEGEIEQVGSFVRQLFTEH